jgi:hypothetical protein
MGSGWPFYADGATQLLFVLFLPFTQLVFLVQLSRFFYGESRTVRGDLRCPDLAFQRLRLTRSTRSVTVPFIGECRGSLFQKLWRYHPSCPSKKLCCSEQFPRAPFLRF